MRLQKSFTKGLSKAKELLNSSTEKLFGNNPGTSVSMPRTSNIILQENQTVVKGKLQAETNT